MKNKVKLSVKTKIPNKNNLQRLNEAINRFKRFKKESTCLNSKKKC